MTDTQAWTRLTDLLTDDPRVRPLVLSAITDPAGYLAAHGRQLGYRGIADAGQVTGIIALIDALAEIGEVAYVDWKEEAPEVQAQLMALPRVQASGVVLDHAGHDDVERVAAAASRQFVPAGLVVVGLDEGSDAYALVVVPTDRLGAVVAAGAAAGDVVVTFG